GSSPIVVPSSRATVSVALPAGNGTTILMGRLGYASAAAAGAEMAASRTVQAANMVRRRSLFMAVSLWSVDNDVFVNVPVTHRQMLHAVVASRTSRKSGRRSRKRHLHAERTDQASLRSSESDGPPQTHRGVPRKPRPGLNPRSPHT